MAAPKGNQNALGNKGGAPSKYKPEYCDLAIEAGTEGKSLTAFAADIGVSRDTITEWCKVHVEFSLAVKKAKAKCTAWYEQELRRVVQNGGGAGTATLIVFGLKNMGPTDWADTVDHSSRDRTMSPKGPKVIDASKLSNAALAELMAARNETADE